MATQTKLEKVRKLYSQLIGTRFNFMGKGEFHLQKIYSIVSKKYPDLCDDSLVCCECCRSSRDQTPEWQHRIRTALGVLKRRDMVGKGYSRGYWVFW